MPDLRSEGVSADTAAAVMTAFAVQKRDRPRSVEAWRATFDEPGGVDGGGTGETAWAAAKAMRDERDVDVRNLLFRGTLETGDRVKRFVIEGRLGAGALGMTYLALDTLSLRLVALKQYSPRVRETCRSEFRAGEGIDAGDDTLLPRVDAEAVDDNGGFRRFQDAAWALNQLRHPHLLSVQEGMLVSGALCLVTEYVRGRTLAAALAQSGPWSEARVTALLAPLLDGLTAMHARGWLHRDIKPGNVMMRETEEPVLIDFDAARQADGRGLLVVQTLVTPGYSPVEQYGEEGEQGPWTDIYALGAVAYEALTGRAPDDAVARVQDDRLPDVAEAAERSVSPKLAAAVMRALAVEPRDRPQTTGEWRAMLEGSGRRTGWRAWRRPFVKGR